MQYYQSVLANIKTIRLMRCMLTSTDIVSTLCWRHIDTYVIELTSYHNVLVVNWTHICLLRVNSVWKVIWILYQIELTGYGIQK